MKIFIVYDTKDKRPLINRDNFGGICAFMGKENAQAYIRDNQSFQGVDTNMEIKEVETTNI